MATKPSTSKANPQQYKAGLDLIQEFEGCELKAYPDPGTGGAPWTIGWGSLRHLDGRAVKQGDVITQAQANAMLAATVDKQVLPALRKLPHWAEMSAEQQGALLSFAWNLGWNFYGAEGFETISKRLREKDWAHVPEALLLYRNPGSSVEAGLRRRREAEGKLWQLGLKDAPAAAPAPTKAALFRIEATQDTWLKKEPVASTELGEKQKVAVPKGKSYAVSAYAEAPADAHALVELAGGAGTWYIYEPHWERDLPSGEAMPASVDWADFGCLVTPNLTVGEVLQWDKRRVPGTNASVRTRLLRTAAEFQKVRDAWGQPLGLTSFYRPEPINAQVGGVPGSRHTTGEAFDLYPTTRSLESFYQWIRTRWTGGLGDGRNRGFVHLDTRGGGCFVPGSGARPAAEWLY
jgi:GH24 family phage-related lysozyme (muramidase)